MDDLILPPQEAILRRILKMFLDRSKNSKFPYKKLELIQTEVNGHPHRLLVYKSKGKAIKLEPVSTGYEIEYLERANDGWIGIEKRTTGINKADFTIENIIDKAVIIINDFYTKYFE